MSKPRPINSKHFEMMKLHYAFLTIVSLFLLLATTKSQDFPVGSCGDQAGGALCAEGFCCSKWGWCGNTSAYCDAENCQSQCPPPPSPPPPPQGQLPCGVQHGGAKCPPGMCCSTNGLCYPDTLRPFCMGHFCQSQCRWPTPPPPPPSEFPPHVIPCGVQYGGATCPPTMCCSVMGFCFNSNDPLYCSKEFCQSQCGDEGKTCGFNGGGICPLAFCCTKDGHCVRWNSPACFAPFLPPTTPTISMLKAIA